MSHRAKKLYQPSSSQPSITSYFPGAGATARGDGVPSASYSSCSSPSSSAPLPARGLSPLPPALQSSLLNVGMRVRKSVPEGYKRGGGGAEKQETHQWRPVFGTSSSAPPALSSRSVSGRSRELVPFCGLHCVGGIERQDEEDEGLPALSFSGSSGSQDSTGFVPGGGQEQTERRKRGCEYDDEVERDLDLFFDDDHRDRDDASQELDGGMVVQGRKIAPMKGRRGPPGIRAGGGGGGGGTGPVRVVGDFDDGDVGFLQPMDVDG